MLERLSEVHKVISSSQRAFTMEGGKGKATRFHIKAKVPDTLSLLWLQYSLALCGSPLFKKLLECGLVNWKLPYTVYLYFFLPLLKCDLRTSITIFSRPVVKILSSSLQVKTRRRLHSRTHKNLARPHQLIFTFQTNFLTTDPMSCCFITGGFFFFVP